MTGYLNVTPNDVLIANNQVFLSSALTNQFINVVLAVGFLCTFIGLGIGLSMKELVIPYVKFKLFDYWEDADYFIMQKNKETID
jgi:hypothetical protein